LPFRRNGTTIIAEIQKNQRMIEMWNESSPIVSFNRPFPFEVVWTEDLCFGNDWMTRNPWQSTWK
jgi:hypothetical protein